MSPPAALAAKRASALTAVLATAACSLLAPSSDDLSGAHSSDAAIAPPVAVDAAALACPVGTKECAGACVPVSALATGCAATSCSPCRAAHAGSLCVGGACAVGACENGWSNCNGRPDDGCEVDTTNSAQFCGTCLVSCSAATPRCELGTCVPRCGAVRFTSTSARFSLPTTGMDVGNGDFAFEIWLKPHGEFVTGQGALFVSNESLAVSSLVVLDAAGKISCDVTESVPNGSGALSAPLPQDLAWHHVACARSSGLLTLYLDGIPRAQAANTNPLSASGTASLGKPSGYPGYEAAAVATGPMRFSRAARYAGAFTPRTFWTVDVDTIAQYLTRRPFDGTTLGDEAGGDNDATLGSSVVASQDRPCP